MCSGTPAGKVQLDDLVNRRACKFTDMKAANPQLKAREYTKDVTFHQIKGDVASNAAALCKLA